MRKLHLRSRNFRSLLSMVRRRSKEDEEEEEEEESREIKDVRPVKQPFKPAWRCFSHEEIHKATNGFHLDNLVGRGGFAEVYKGVLDDGRKIAVKRMTRASTEEHMEKDFLTELGTVGHVRHPNVTNLLGCCIDRNLHLIFEFSSLGSVSSNLHDENSQSLAWTLRYKIAVGTARGLHYLHKECKRRIIHRDIKASNILLTTNYEPQISDFGLAKWLPSEWTHCAVKPIEGTFGCLAPEYFMRGIVDEKTDVFAFGVFLLEIISGRKPVDGSHKSLLTWAKPYLSDGTIEALIDSRIGDDYDMEQLKRLGFAASLCIRGASTSRPSMTEVLELLEGRELKRDWCEIPAEEEEEEFSGFDYLDEDDEDNPWTSSSSPSVQEKCT